MAIAQSGCQYLDVNEILLFSQLCLQWHFLIRTFKQKECLFKNRMEARGTQLQQQSHAVLYVCVKLLQLCPTH